MNSDPFRINALYTEAGTSFFNDWQHIKELQVVADMAADSGCEYLEKELRERISRVQAFIDMVEASVKKQKEREKAGDHILLDVTSSYLPPKSVLSTDEYNKHRRAVLEKTVQSLSIPRQGWPEKKIKDEVEKT